MAKVAILGLGTVGSGVAEVLTKNASSISRRAGEEVTVKYILGRHDYPESPFRDLVVQDFSIIENDPEVTVVAECIGGTGAARDYTLRALKAGKSVVTSNKEVVAEYGDEFLAIAREKNLNYLYEASVGGGIPIIRPLGSCLAANEISEIYGILNGTTNYILTKMIKEGLSFDTALAEAQEKGYAEADPTADVEGHDACRKICILASLSFGRHIYPRSVPTTGITGVTAADVALAEAAGMKIKLLGRAIRQEDGKVVAYVSPHLLPEDHQLAGVEDVFNGIVVCGDAIGDVMFYGRGAGKLPTASAVSADIIDAVKHKDRRQNMDWAPGGDEVVGDYSLLPMKWYIRTSERDVRIGTVFGDVETVTAQEASGDRAVFTGLLTRKELEQRLAGFEAKTCLPVLE
ncbi:MAG: homoserine dehydrogenase [Oscillospiraceae bacterium]|nr:homoserine dehydrogenase [Oscillospiraceae bacterium]